MKVEFIGSGTADPAVTNRLPVAENHHIFKVYKQKQKVCRLSMSTLVRIDVCCTTYEHRTDNLKKAAPA